MAGAGEGGVGRHRIAHPELHADIPRRVLPDARGPVFHGVVDVYHGGPRLVGDFSLVGGIPGLGGRRGYHKGDAIAHVAHAVGDEDRPEGAMALGAAAVLGHEQRRQAAESVGGDVGTGQHGEHAGATLRARAVDAADPRVRVRRQDDRRVGLARQRDVVDVAPAPRHEAPVFHAPHGLPDAERAHIGVVTMRPLASTYHRSLGKVLPSRVEAIQSAIRTGGNGPRFAAGTLPTECRES